MYETLGSASIKNSLRIHREINGSTSNIDDFEDGVWRDHLWKTMAVIRLEQGTQEMFEEDSQRPDNPKCHLSGGRLNQSCDEDVYLATAIR